MSNLIETYTVELIRVPRLDVTIRPAVPSDITGIKLIAEAGRQIGGFCEFHLYKDGTQVTIYTLATAAEWRKHGIGRILVGNVCELAPLTQLKCVADLPANKFYRDLGFTCVRTEAGKRRELNVWQYRQCQCGRCKRDPSGWPAGMCHWCGEKIGKEPIAEGGDEAICDECWIDEYGDGDEGEDE